MAWPWEKSNTSRLSEILLEVERLRDDSAKASRRIDQLTDDLIDLRDTMRRRFGRLYKQEAVDAKDAVQEDAAPVRAGRPATVLEVMKGKR